MPMACWWSDAPTEIFVAGKIDHLDIALWASRFEGHVNPVARFRAPAISRWSCIRRKGRYMQ